MSHGSSTFTRGIVVRYGSALCRYTSTTSKRPPGQSRRDGPSGTRFDQLLVVEPGDDPGEGLVDRLAARVHRDLRRHRRLVGIRDAGEILDLAAQRLRVQTLFVSADQFVDRAFHEDLDEA